MPAAAPPKADKVTRQQAAGWRFPVCAACVQHIARLRAARLFTRWFRFGGLGLVFLITVAAGSASVLLFGGALVFALAALAGYLGGREARSLCKKGCASAGPPVTFAGFSGNVDSFDFAQQGYAGDFMRANLEKLAALPHETQKFIQPDLDRVAAAEAQRRADERERARAVAEAEAQRKAEKAALERERARIAAEVAHDNEIYDKCLERLDAAKGPAGRRGALEAGLRSLRQEHMRERLMLEASRIEVAAALAKAEGQKSAAARMRTLSEALEAIRNDAIPDHLQLDLIRSLEGAIAQLEDEKNSIDMA